MGFMSPRLGGVRRHGVPLLARWRSDVRGATAVEFGMVAAPFFLLMMSIMTVGLQFFTSHALDNGVSVAARKIRTGQAQKEGKTLAHFRQMVCAGASSYINCNSNLVIHVKSGDEFADLDPPISCTTNGSLTPSAGLANDPLANHSGEESAAVLITACYQWDLGGSLWQTVYNLLTVGPGGVSQQTAGKTIIQSTVSFRTEPYK
jgi:Flp pilus assembly protein TadG